MPAYYNEWEPYCAQWLRNLTNAGLLPAGTVDARDIADVTPADLQGFLHCHFFAGIGGWPYGLQLAGWPAERPVWTASLPCQPFSYAGQRLAGADERHVWPVFYRLVAECHPVTLVGEQVASDLGRDWVARVRSDLERLGYAVGVADLTAAGVGAPHIRQRLFWVADQPRDRRHQECAHGDGQPARDAAQGRAAGPPAGGAFNGLADPAEPRCDDARQHAGGPPSLPARSVQCGAADGLADSQPQLHGSRDAGPPRRPQPADGGGAADGMGDAARQRLQGEWADGAAPRRQAARRPIERPGGALCGGLDDATREQMGRARQPWQNSAWLACLDGKARRVEPCYVALATGVPGDVGLAGPEALADFIALLPGSLIQARLAGDSCTEQAFGTLLHESGAHALAATTGGDSLAIWASLPAGVRLRFQSTWRTQRWVRSAVPPVVTKTFARAQRLQAYGNAVVPQLAAAFARAVLEIP